jgi:hypothetical protein
MNFIQIGMEDEGTNPDVPESGDDVNLQPNETQTAIDAVNNQDSTEPAKQLQVANYKEELAILQQQKANELPEGEDPANPAPENGPDDGVVESPANTEDTPIEEPNADDGEDDDNQEDGDDTSSEESTEEDAEPVNTDAEMGSSGVGKDEGQVAQEQYILEGHRMVAQALESIHVMGKYHDFITARSKLGGISQHTAKVVNNAFEHHALVCGYKPMTPTPAMEDFATYSGSLYSTQQLQIGIEGFLETVWQAIKKFFKSIWTWIMDMLTPKKQAPTMSPADKAARDKVVIELTKQNEKLQKTLDKIDVNRERDNARKGEAEAERLRREAKNATARLNQRLAAQLFKTSDKGSFSEISQNARMMSEVAQAAAKHAMALAKIVNLAGAAALGGRKLQPSELGIGKNSITGITFNQVQRGNKSALVEAHTDEIFGGIGARFMFAGTDVNAIGKTIGPVKVIQELGHQGFKITSVHEKSGFPTQMPVLEKSDLTSLREIVTEVAATFKGINVIQEHVTKVAGGIKELAEKQEPSSWQGLSKEDVAVLQMQLNFVGLIETNLVAGYKSFNDQVNNFKNAYMRLTEMYVSE